MGRKPVVGLVSACLASVALAGCCDNNSCWPGGSKKDTQPPVNNSTAARTQQQRQGQTVSTGAPGTGNTAGSGSTAIATRPPVDQYPSDRTFGNGPAATTGGVERAGFSEPDASAGRTTAPTNTAANFKDPNANGLPPVSGVPAQGGAAARPTPSTLPPIVTGQARPRIDDINVAPGGKGAVITPATPAGRDVGPANEAPPLPPPAPVSLSGPDELPPIPARPSAPTTVGTQAPPPLPPSPPPLPRGMGVPMPVQNQATMQGGAPNQ
jgi:hypothetical protein